MAELGELGLWAALPLAVLAVVASVGGGWTGRADLAVVGRRAAEAAAVLQLIALAGLAYALLNVQLRYVYVAAVSDFDEPPFWRLAASWSAPEGGALVLALLITIVAAISGRLGRTRQAAARTGAVAALAVIGLLMVLARAQPFAQREAPALVGGALPFALKNLAWQIELWAAYLAIACGGLTLGGVVGGQLVDSGADDRVGRGAMRLAAAALSLAVLAAAWRLYAGSGRLFDAAGLSGLAAYLPSWLLALSYLHAPGGPATPVWATRWARIFGVAFFPAAVATGAAVVGAAGRVPSPSLWAGGLAIGVLAGAMAGMARGPEAPVGRLEALPGFGPWAFAGAVVTLGCAGIVVVWSLAKGPVWTHVGWPVALLAVAAAVGWSVARPAVRRRTWGVAAVAAALAAAAGGFVLSGGGGPVFVVACAISGASLLGAAADLTRLRASRNVGRADVSRQVSELLAVRRRRRWASVFGHLGFALLLVGLSAERLRLEKTRPLSPGDRFELAGPLGARAQVTYLGLSRYQVGQLDKRVASLRLSHGGSASRLIAPSLVTDVVAGRVSREPALVRGASSDVVVEIAGRLGDEVILCRLAHRPLAACFWLGGLLVLASSIIGAGGRR